MIVVESRTKHQCMIFSVASHAKAKCIDGRLAPHISNTIPQKSSRLPKDAADGERFHVTWQLRKVLSVSVSMDPSHPNNKPCRTCEAQSNADKVKHKQECLSGLRILDLVVDVRVEMKWEPCKEETSNGVRVDVYCMGCQHLIRVAEGSCSYFTYLSHYAMQTYF